MASDVTSGDLSKKDRRRAVWAHLSFVLFPWYGPLLMRQSTREPSSDSTASARKFVEQHRRVAQRIQGVMLLTVMGLAITGFAAGLVVVRAGASVAYMAFAAWEIWLARQASKGTAYRLDGLLIVARSVETEATDDDIGSLR